MYCLIFFSSFFFSLSLFSSRPDQIFLFFFSLKTMSDTGRLTTRWPSSMPTKTKSNSPIRHTIPLILSRRKLLRSAKNHQQTFAQRMAKVKHDTEELYQLCYSHNIKFDTFQQQMITGKMFIFTKILLLKINFLFRNTYSVYTNVVSFTALL